MKIFRFIAVVAAAFAVPVAAFAASLTLAPANVTPAVGQTFTVTITADPADTKAYTVRANVAFDPSLVQFESFLLAPKWMALSQAGYDVEDNTSGALIKTAGYPGGITAPTVFGTATFRVVVAGTSTIRVTADSLALGSTGQNQITGVQGATTVTVAAPPPKPVVKPVETPKPTVQSSIAPVVGTTTVEEATATPPLLIATSSTAAAAAAGAPFGISWWWWGILLLIIIGAGFFWFRRRPDQMF